MCVDSWPAAYAPAQPQTLNRTPPPPHTPHTHPQAGPNGLRIADLLDSDDEMVESDEGEDAEFDQDFDKPKSEEDSRSARHSPSMTAR